MRPVVIIDPLSSGVELAPTFKARGIPAIAVTLTSDEWPEFGSKMRAEDFVAVIPDQPGIEELIRAHDPIAIIPGTEEGIPLAERLTLALTPQLANDADLAKHRMHKSLMQEALAAAGVPALKSFFTDSLEAAEDWIQQNEFISQPFILKPPASSGSEMVFHIDAGADWRAAFRSILGTPSVVTGLHHDAVVIQEQAIGTEYALGTVSTNGTHSLVHIIKYNKVSLSGRKTVYDHVEFIPYESIADTQIFEYAKSALDALGIRWGATHTEIILTSRGPRLIETSARMIGGPVVNFARAATGSSQADRLVDVYTGASTPPATFDFKKTVVSVFLRAFEAGNVINLGVLEEARQLSTMIFKYVWIQEGKFVPKTVDYLTSIGIIALAGDREAIFRDYQRIRELEAQLIFRA